MVSVERLPVDSEAAGVGCAGEAAAADRGDVQKHPLVPAGGHAWMGVREFVGADDAA